MKLSKKTLGLLKNFSTINTNLLITPGKKLSTLAASKSVFASAKVAEEFDTEFGIYDLNVFLGALSIYDDPEITFEEKFAKIEKGGFFKFYSADKTVLTYPQKEIQMPSVYETFEFPSDTLALIQKTSGVIGATDVMFEGNGEKLFVHVLDKKNVGSNTFSKEIGDTDKTFKVFMKQENMKFLMNDYTVNFSDKRIAQFVSEDVEYFISLESDSSFE